MPLIQPEKKVSNEQLKLNVPSDSLQELRAYGRFLNNSSLTYIVTQLIATLGRDKEFQQWKAGHQAEVQAATAPISQNGAQPKE
jgi:post-segregation antitoxin (ccd killing protein)